MARGTQHRKRRPQTNAGVAARTAGPPAEAAQAAGLRGAALLRPAAQPRKVRLRRRWPSVFVLSFVFLGVGSGSTGISQIVSELLQRHLGSSKSLGSLQKQTVEHPKSAAAWLAYANKLQQDSKWDDAAAALTTYTTLKPKDTDQLSAAGVALPSPRPGLEHRLPGPAALHADADARVARRAEVDLAARQGARDRDEPARERGLGPDLDRRRATPTSRCSATSASG